MSEPSPTPASAPRWTLGDFVFAFLGGLAGALLGSALGIAVDDVAVTLVGTLLGQYLGHLLALGFVTRRRETSLAGLGLDVVPIDGLYLLYGAALQFVIAFLFAPFAVLLELEGSQQAITEMLPAAQGPALRAFLVVALALLAPLVEEVMFRGLLMKVAERWKGPRVGLVLTAFLFALFHLLGIGADDFWRAAALLIPQFFLVGLVLGRLTQRHGRLGPAIFTHAGFNLVAVMTLFLLPGLTG